MKLFRVHILVHESGKKEEKDRYTFAENSILASQQVLNHCASKQTEAYTISVNSVPYDSGHVYQRL